jgi:GTP cyclohydrolase I
MGRKETAAVVLICGLTTILKICSIVALYNAKPQERITTECIEVLQNHALYNDVLIVGDGSLAINPEIEVKFKTTFLE